MTDRKSTDSDALKLLIDSGVVDRKATLEDFVRLSSQLEQLPAGDLNPSLSWSFFVKGKYINRDDSPPMLDILRKSGGGAVTVEDEEMIGATREVGAAEGLFVAPEGAACFVALQKLLGAGTIGASDRIVIFNTGSGIKYLDCYE